MSSEFFDAVKKGDTNQVASLIQTLKIPIDTKDSMGITALMYAVGCNHTELVKWLLKNGADPHACDDEGYNVLWGIEENNPNEEIRLAVVTAIMQANHYIASTEFPTKNDLITILEQQLLYEISLSTDGYPYYSDACTPLRRLILVLDPNFFEDKLLAGARQNDATTVVAALQCGADPNKLHAQYCQTLKKIIDDEKNEVKQVEHKETKSEFKEEKSDNKPKSYTVFLGYLQRIITLADNFLKFNYKNNDEATARRYIGSSLIDAKKLLAEYQYKETRPYKENSAILFLTMLALEARKVEKPNIPPDAPVIRDKEAKRDFSLQEICQEIFRALQCENQKRTIAFLALGFTKSGLIFATTNYHAPRVYHLDDLLNLTRFKTVTALYEKHMRQVGHGHVSYSQGKVHAETMLAALADNLEIEQILIVDQSGLKKQNCLCCASYLCQKGFSNEPHFEGIKNYVVPTAGQIQAVTTVLREQKQTTPRFQFVGKKDKRTTKKADLNSEKIVSMLPASEQETVLRTNNPSQTIFDFILRYHPHNSSTSQKEGIVTLFGETAKLVHADTRFFGRDRVITKTKKAVRSKEAKSVAKLNLRLEYKEDGRLKSEDTTTFKEDPDSPRSYFLSRFGNGWLKKGVTASVTPDETAKTWVLTRNLRA